MIDLGDIIGVEGPMMETQTGEYSVKASKVTMLAKAIRPLPCREGSRGRTGQQEGL